MRAVVQRVTEGSVMVVGEAPNAIAGGLVVLIGATHTDSPAQAKLLAHKIAQLRIFEDEAGKMNRSLLDVDGEVLVVPQFTLYADCRRGRRPSFTDAALPEQAIPLIDEFVNALRAEGVRRVASGFFGEHMMVEILNDGPVTIVLDTGML